MGHPKALAEPESLIVSDIVKKMFPEMIIPKIVSDACLQFSVSIDHAQGLPIAFEQLRVDFPDWFKSAAPKRQLEYLASRYCLSQVLKQANLNPDLKVERKSDRSPIWPDQWVGSITHSNCVASVTMAPKALVSSIGIDIEEVMPIDTARKVAKAILTDSEVGGDDRFGFEHNEWVTLLLSAKESLYKCLHPFVGKFFGFDYAEIFEVHRTERRCLIRLTKDLSPNFIRGFDLPVQWTISNGRVFTAVELFPK